MGKSATFRNTLQGILMILLGLTLLVMAATRVSSAAPECGQSAATGHDYGAGHHQHTSPAGTDAASERCIQPLLGNLGSHRHPITTNSALAQRYFDEGLVLTFGFNHPEAIRSFEDAATLDPSCAMCYWGIALALGPNINAPMGSATVPEAWSAIQKARELAPGVSEREQAYIAALAQRYAAEPPADRSALDLAYAEAMRELARSYPDDLDAATLFAEALMDLSPWQYWTKDGQPTTYTEEIVATLESVLARNPSHPGANHYYIHAVEASHSPERAVPSAERLAALAPGAGHLVHMPAHIYWRVGRYHDAYLMNEHAIHADEGYIPDRNARASSYALGYYPHNIHFLFAAAQMEGNSRAAIEAARKLVAANSDDVYRAMPALEDYRPTELFALARFGKWAAILEQPAPPADLKYTSGAWHWARGMAYLRLGQSETAERELERLAAIAGSEAARQQALSSASTPSTLLGIGAHILRGELAGSRGQLDEQIAELRAAVATQDELPYIEPPAWFYPVRQDLGAALLEAGRAAEAEAVYREDLRQYPNNGWSLFGLVRSLEAQGKNAEAAEARARFEQAWRHADVTLTSSRL